MHEREVQEVRARALPIASGVIMDWSSARVRTATAICGVSAMGAAIAISPDCRTEACARASYDVATTQWQVLTGGTAVST